MNKTSIIPKSPQKIEVCNNFAMDYHVTVFFDLDKIIISKEEVLENFIQRLNKMNIFLVMTLMNL